ncbi:hypothetical protein PUN28_001893 [Cardiocondyla obscurior]|uniref:Protein-lysine N-methyltransferase PUN28_001893 n=1 Tax=Cardiocondyla obscurior TaxID=286306 RepID=A0AAW2GRK7_9HYME
MTERASEELTPSDLGTLELWIAARLNLNKENDKIIDVGCGNAMTLVELAKEGFANLVGVDYSQKGVELARMVLNDNNFPNVKIEICDILDNTLPHDFKIVHDKGTYDAISLNPENSTAQRQKYIENIHRILLPDGYFILTSCNWTKEELLRHFTSHFELDSQLPADTFQFGGQTGNTVTQLVFKKK